MSLPISDTESALFDKFNKLQTAINRTREKQKELDDEKDLLKTKVECLQQSRAEMEKSIKMTEYESLSLRERLKGATRAEQEASITDLSHQQPPQLVEFWKQYSVQQRQGFIDQSRRFRRDIKRLKLSNPECGIAALLELHGAPIDPVVVDNRSTEQLREEWGVAAMSCQAKDDADGPHLDQLVQARKAYQRAFLTREKAKQEHDKIEMRHYDATDRRSKRRQRRQQLKVQLQRVRVDVQSLEKDLADVKEQTNETRSLTKSYRERAISSSVGPSATGVAKAKGDSGFKNQGAVNPYVKANTDKPPASCRKGKTKVKSKDTSRVKSNTTLFTPPRTAVERQHPHFVGRMPRGLLRQFGASAGTGVVEGDEASEEIADHVQPLSRTIMLETSDDDSDDDDIQSFVAFRKK